MIKIFLLLIITLKGYISLNNYFYFSKNKAFKVSFKIKKSIGEDSTNEIASEFKNDKNNFYHFGTFPRLEYPNDKGQLTWYPIGFSKDFGIKPKQVTIRDVNFIVWRDKSTYYGIRDCCSHQGSSFMLGETCKNTISCPYHGYIFDGSNGELIQIPKLPHIESNNHNIDCFKVVEKGDVIYFNTIPIRNEEMRKQIDESNIFVEPEYYDKDQRAVYLNENFEHYA